MGACACVCAASMSNMDPSSVDCSPCLVEIRAARRCVVSLMLFFFHRIHDAHCWLLCRPGGKNRRCDFFFLILATFIAHKLIMRVFLIVVPRMRIWLPIHPGEALKRKSPPSTKTEKSDQEVVFGLGIWSCCRADETCLGSSPSFVSHFIHKYFSREYVTWRNCLLLNKCRRGGIFLGGKADLHFRRWQ